MSSIAIMNDSLLQLFAVVSRFNPNNETKLFTTLPQAKSALILIANTAASAKSRVKEPTAQVLQLFAQIEKAAAEGGLATKTLANATGAIREIGRTVATLRSSAFAPAQKADTPPATAPAVITRENWRAALPPIGVAASANKPDFSHLHGAARFKASMDWEREQKAAAKQARAARMPDFSHLHGVARFTAILEWERANPI